MCRDLIGRLKQYQDMGIWSVKNDLREQGFSPALDEAASRGLTSTSTFLLDECKTFLWMDQRWTIKRA